MKKYLVIVFGFIIVGIGFAFTLKANVGVGAWDALSASLNSLTGIEVGTLGMILNVACVLGQIIILRKDFKLIQLLQIPLSILLGSVINFVLYDVLIFPFDSFLGGIIMYIVSTEVCVIGVALIMVLDEVTFALEGFCDALTRIIPYKFHTIRQFADILSFCIIIILTFFTHIPWSIGIGTIIGMVIFGPSLGVFMKLFKNINQINI
ncbi:MAG: YczE/YyaS/YitT family protein [Longibaculum sp.]